MKKVEALLEMSEGYDKKCKVNRLHKKVPDAYLNMIEQGISIEKLGDIISAGFPVFKYRTQITIHGLFSDLSNNRVNGYVNLMQNKNRSVGVRYSAIDEEKRERIAERLKVLGINYLQTSTDRKFRRTWAVTKENYQETLTEVKRFSEKFNASLIIGIKQIWLGEQFGFRYLVFDLYINAIYERNIEAFLEGAGATKQAYQDLKDKRDREKAEREEKYKAEQERRAEIQRQEKAKHQDNLDLLKATYTMEKRTSAAGVYLKPRFNYIDEIEYVVAYVYLMPGKQKPRCSRRSFQTLNEALNYKPEQKFSDNILRGTVTGYKIA